jgi:hypothetical protein
MSRKKNHRMANRQLRLHPLERARVRQAWAERTVNGHIHALTGNDPEAAVERVGTLVYVVLGACLLQRLHHDHPDIRVLTATVNALAECVAQPQLTDLQRGSLAGGLEAVKRLVAVLPEEALFISATYTQRDIQAFGGGLTVGHFQSLATRMQPAAAAPVENEAAAGTASNHENGAIAA